MRHVDGLSEAEIDILLLDAKTRNSECVRKWRSTHPLFAIESGLGLKRSSVPTEILESLLIIRNITRETRRRNQ